MSTNVASYEYFGGQNSGPVEVDDIHDLIVKKDGETLGNYNPLVGDARIDIPSDAVLINFTPSSGQMTGPIFKQMSSAITARELVMLASPNGGAAIYWHLVSASSVSYRFVTVSDTALRTVTIQTTGDSSENHALTVSETPLSQLRVIRTGNSGDDRGHEHTAITTALGAGQLPILCVTNPSTTFYGILNGTYAGNRYVFYGDRGGNLARITVVADGNYTEESIGEILRHLSIVSNREYLYAIVGADDTFLFGIKKDGSVDWAKGIPAPIKAGFDQVIGRINTLDGTVATLVQICSRTHIISNEEFVYAIVDENDTFLFGITKDGSVNWSKGLPSWLESRLHALESAVPNKVDKVVGKSLINSVFASGVSVVSNEEFIMAVTDSDGAFLFGIKKDGTFDWAKGIPNVLQFALSGLQADIDRKVDKVVGKSLIDDQFASHTDSTPIDPEWFWALVDPDGRLVEGITQEGIHVFKTPVRFDGGINWSDDNLNDLVQALKDIGFTGGAGDWSDSKSLEIPIPEMAVINFTNISQMPQTKTTDAHAIMEFWDMNGNYFKKKVIANAQGSSSLSAPKKNISIDLCNDEWVGDDTFKIKFGGWVPQDSFHIKAYYTDFFRCVGLSGYDLVKKILDTRVPNTTWKKALNYGTDPIGHKSVSPQIDSGALCYPQGFLCKVYLNGVFEGLFCWQLKKHRDNYNLNKKTAENIHIEGMLGGVFFGGTIDWTAFEIRNPKDLITYTGTKYDGDNPTELIDSTSPAYDPANSKHKLSAKVKQYIIDLSNRMSQIGNDPAVFEQYFDVDSCVDYVILSDAIYNYDYVKNIQWTTWDGVKWFVNPYDLDCTLGANSAGDGIHYPTTSHIITATNHPLTFAVNHYTSELEQRWKELRDAHIIDARLMTENLEHYVRLFGKDGYKAEYDKWTNAPCNRDPVFDTDNWDLERDADGNPVIYTAQYHDWNGTQTYAPGYVVQYNLTGSSIGNFGWWFRFTAKQTNTNKPPITQRGFKDNLFRVYNWLNQQISNMDTLYNYA